MNADDVLTYGHKWVLQHVEDLPEKEWYTQGVCGWWSVRDIIGHLASFELLFVDAANSILDKGASKPTVERFGELGGEKFNKEQVAKRQNLKPREALAEYTEIQAKVRELVKQIPAETRRKTGLLPWYGDEYDLEDLISYTNYGHKREHCAQIAVFKDTLKLE